MNHRLAAAVLAASLAPSIADAASVELTDGNLTGVFVYDTGPVLGTSTFLDGSAFGWVGIQGLAHNCGVLTAPSAITGSAESWSYTAGCGSFNVAVRARMLSPLPSAALTSSGYEVEYVFTNPTGGALALSQLIFADDDLTAFSQNEAAYDTASKTFWVRDTAATPDNFLAVIASTDDPTAVYSWDVDLLGATDNTFPLDGGVGPVGPGDIAYSIGFETTVAAGASVTFRYRYAFVHAVTSVPADFDLSSCYTSPPTDCLPSNKGLLSFKDDIDNSKDKLIWKFLNGEAATQADFGNPTADTDFSLCVYDGNGDQLTSLHVPASATKWAPVSTLGYKFIDASAASSGVAKSQLKGGVSGKSKITLLAKGENLPDVTLGALATPIRVQMNAGTGAGKCFNTTLGTVVSNLSGLLKAKAP